MSSMKHIFFGVQFAGKPPGDSVPSAIQQIFRIRDSKCRQISKAVIQQDTPSEFSQGLIRSSD